MGGHQTPKNCGICRASWVGTSSDQRRLTSDGYEGWLRALIARGSVLDCGCPLPLLASESEEPAVELRPPSNSRPFPKRQRTGALQNLANIPLVRDWE